MCVGGGGGLQYEMPGCLCCASKNVPMTKDPSSQKPHPCGRDPLHTSYPNYDVISS